MALPSSPAFSATTTTSSSSSSSSFSSSSSRESSALSREYWNGVLRSACYSRNLSLVRTALSQSHGGAARLNESDEEGTTPLMIACKRDDNADVIRYLCERQQHEKEREEIDFFQTDQHGCTAFHWSCRSDPSRSPFVFHPLHADCFQCQFAGKSSTNFLTLLRCFHQTKRQKQQRQQQQQQQQQQAGQKTGEGGEGQQQEWDDDLVFDILTREDAVRHFTPLHWAVDSACPLIVDTLCSLSSRAFHAISSLSLPPPSSFFVPRPLDLAIMSRHVVLCFMLFRFGAVFHADVLPHAGLPLLPSLSVFSASSSSSSASSSASASAASSAASVSASSSSTACFPESSEEDEEGEEDDEESEEEEDEWYAEWMFAEDDGDETSSNRVMMQKWKKRREKKEEEIAENAAQFWCGFSQFARQQENRASQKRFDMAFVRSLYGWDENRRMDAMVPPLSEIFPAELSRVIAHHYLGVSVPFDGLARYLHHVYVEAKPPTTFVFVREVEEEGNRKKKKKSKSSEAAT